MDPRNAKLSNLIVNYSTAVQPGERVLIEYEDQVCIPFVKELIRDVYKAGGKPYVHIRDSRIIREICMGCDEEQMAYEADYLLHEYRGMNAYIGVRAFDNVSELSDVPPEKMNLYTRAIKPTRDALVDNTKWSVLKFPNAAMAQLANMSEDAFTDFYYDVCTIDYAKMSRAMDPLVKLMEETDKVHILAPGTDLTFSIRGIPVIKCDGKINIPDGEIYTSPVKDSVNGVISYNTISQEQGFTYENVRFEVKDGKIISATCNDNARINALLDTDEGARYFGEFAIGVHPYILHPMKDTLFDEKIAGSFHLTPGRAYENAFNGNVSAVHWDLTLIQRPEYGGGEIWFDDVLIRKDGLFVLPELEPLNPENLK
ncbi:MAG: aminopeptidase [Emergencia sp.]